MRAITKNGSVMPGALRSSGIRTRGFTIIELLLVLLLIALLASVVTPVVNKSIVRAREATLKENLFIVRKAIDDFYADKGHYPEALKQLVDDRYIRAVPVDPIYQAGQQWSLIYSDAGNSFARGIIDLRSLSADISSEGNPYNEW